jgi:hypothetical protein
VTDLVDAGVAVGQQKADTKPDRRQRRDDYYWSHNYWYND